MRYSCKWRRVQEGRAAAHRRFSQRCHNTEHVLTRYVGSVLILLVSFSGHLATLEHGLLPEDTPVLLDAPGLHEGRPPSQTYRLLPAGERSAYPCSLSRGFALISTRARLLAGL